MSDLEYSIDALEAKSLFYNKSVTVYVEGEEDILFWSNIFDLASVSAHIEDVNGKEEINKRVDQILEDNAQFLVAVDNDHHDFIGDSIDHPKVIRTYGYSIENSMYYHTEIERVVQKMGKSNVKVKEQLLKWAEEFTNDIYDLLIYDVANHRFKKGVKIFGDSCVRFLENNSSIKISRQSVSDYLKDIEAHFTEKELNEVRNLINESQKDVWFHIKGHFLTNAVINLIRHLVLEKCGSKCKISLDSLYALTVDISQTAKDRVDIKHLVNQVNQIKIA